MGLDGLIGCNWCTDWHSLNSPDRCIHAGLAMGKTTFCKSSPSAKAGLVRASTFISKDVE